MKTISPTLHPDVNEILTILLSGVQEILGDQFVGMYLFGSLANGDFDQSSDIDVLVVTAVKVSTHLFSALQAMHTRMTELNSPWAIQLEVSYIPQNALRRFDPKDNLHPHMDRGNNETLHMMTHASDWIIQRHILRERGLVITGPELLTLIDPVSPNDLLRATVDVLPLWVNPILDDPSQINKRGYQSFFVLSLCRMLYTIKHGGVVSKPFAAQWAKENLSRQWTSLIERAWIGRQNPGLEAQPEDINGTLDLIRYTLQQIDPTPYPDVNEVLNMVLFSVKEILGNQFIGMYLYGSLSSGDFDPETSDIDFLVVTADAPSDKTVSELEALHNRIWATGLKWPSKLEGAYVPKELVRRHDPHGIRCPTLNEGQFYVDKLGSDWIIQRHIIRECGTVLEGSDPKTIIDPVSTDDIRSSTLGILNEWWFPMLDDPSWLKNHGNEYHAFAILTMCRALHALEQGTIVSKPVAARWAQNKLGEKWGEVIEHSIRGQKPGGEKIDLFNDAMELIRYTKETINT